MFLFLQFLTHIDHRLDELSDKIDEDIYRYEKYISIINSRNKNGQIIRNRIHFNNFNRQKSTNINRKMILFNTCVDANNTLCGYVFEKQSFFNSGVMEFRLDKHYVTTELSFGSFSDDCFTRTITIKIHLNEDYLYKNIILDKGGTTVTFETPLLLDKFVVDKYEGGTGHNVCLPIVHAHVYEK